jgi:hypothetical protein
MPLSEGTCICLLLGILSFTLLLRNLVNNQNASVRPNLALGNGTASTETTATATPSAPVLTAEEQLKRVEALLEAQNREQWCREFEEQETARHFREKFCELEFNRQFDEAWKLEEAQSTLINLRRQRQALEKNLFLNDLVGKWGASY